jgi:glutamate synthase domain-containing protein 3
MGKNRAMTKPITEIPTGKTEDRLVIDASRKYYKVLNQEIRLAVSNGARAIELRNVNGQRYLADGINTCVKIYVHGTPGNNLGAFAHGAELYVHGNAQEQLGNTMNSGKIVLFGNASDVVGYGMRGGKIFIRGDAGYRVGIHMKEYKSSVPVIIVGGTTGDFLGEYMAGGILIVLGLTANAGEEFLGDYVGTGMHGGVLYVRGEPVPAHRLGKEPARVELTEKDNALLAKLLREYSTELGLDYDMIMSRPFFKYIPQSHRPYGKMYANQP